MQFKEPAAGLTLPCPCKRHGCHLHKGGLCSYPGAHFLPDHLQIVLLLLNELSRGLHSSLVNRVCS